MTKVTTEVEQKSREDAARRSSLWGEQDAKCVVVLAEDDDRRIGLRCPHCGQTEKFAVDVFGIATLGKGNKVTGFQPTVHDEGWINCLVCGLEGCFQHEHTVAEFRYELAESCGCPVHGVGVATNIHEFNSGLHAVPNGVEPVEKDPHIDAWVKFITGKDRNVTISDGNCMTCSRVNVTGGLRGEEELAEYRISGMCQVCQDATFSLALKEAEDASMEELEMVGDLYDSLVRRPDDTR